VINSAYPENLSFELIVSMPHLDTSVSVANRKQAYSKAISLSDTDRIIVKGVAHCGYTRLTIVWPILGVAFSCQSRKVKLRAKEANCGCYH